MILEFFSLEELISRAKAVNEAWEKTLGNVSKSIFLTSKAPPTAESEDQRLGKVKESVFKKVAKKAGEDTLNQALADSLSARVSGRRLKEAYLQDLSGCPLIVAQLRELCLIPYGDHIRWVKEIRRLNPDINWHFLVISGGLSKINDSELLDGLRGSLDIYLETQDDVRELEGICENCHPDLRLKLKITPHAGVFLPDVVKSGSIVKQLAKLTADVREERDFDSLDVACKEFEFDTALAISKSCHHLQKCAHLPSSLVDLEMLYPTSDELSWVEEIGRKQPGFQLALRPVDNVQTVSTFTNSRLALRDLAIAEPLTSQADVSLFRQICQAHPDMAINITLENATLLRMLHDLPMGIDVLLRSGKTAYCNAAIITLTPDSDDDYVEHLAKRWQPSHVQQNLKVSCDSDRLPYLLDLDLPRLSELSLLLNGNDLDYALLRQTLSQCSGLKQLLLRTGSSSTRSRRDLYELRGFVQTAVANQSWPNLELFAIRSLNHKFFDVDLPINFVKETEDHVWRWRRQSGLSSQRTYFSSGTILSLLH